MDIDKLRLDSALVDGGVWRPFDDDTSVKVACMEKKAYRNKLGRISLKALAKSRNREMEQTERDELTFTAMVGTIVLDWRGLSDNGAPLEFSDAKALELLQNIPDFRDFCQRESGNYDNFRLHMKDTSADGENGEAPPTSPEARLKSGIEVPS